MSLIDEIFNQTDDNREQTSSTEIKQLKESNRKYYTFYVALGALKNYGFVEFETGGGEIKSFTELIHKPCVANAKLKMFFPRRDGKMFDKDNNIVLIGKVRSNI